MSDIPFLLYPLLIGEAFKLEEGINLQVYNTPDVFLTLTQWKLLWFTNFSYLAVGQNIPWSISSLLIGRGRNPNLSRWRHKLMNKSFLMIVTNILKFWRKYKRHLWGLCLAWITIFRNYFAKTFKKIDLYVNSSMQMSLDRL